MRTALKLSLVVCVCIIVSGCVAKQPQQTVVHKGLETQVTLPRADVRISLRGMFKEATLEKDDEFETALEFAPKGECLGKVRVGILEFKDEGPFDSLLAFAQYAEYREGIEGPDTHFEFILNNKCFLIKDGHPTQSGIQGTVTSAFCRNNGYSVVVGLAGEDDCYQRAKVDFLETVRTMHFGRENLVYGSIIGRRK